jgi:hypothetical protein
MAQEGTLPMHDAPYRLVPVTNGKGNTVHAKVSPEDADSLSRYRWHTVQGYVARNGGEGEALGVYIHRQILGRTHGDGTIVDHINRDKLDNRRTNLRLVTPTESARNTPSRKGTSIYRGVCWVPRLRKWKAQAGFHGVNYLGMHAEEDDAARAVNAFWVERGYPAPNLIPQAA